MNEFKIIVLGQEKREENKKKLVGIGYHMIHLKL